MLTKARLLYLILGTLLVTFALAGCGGAGKQGDAQSQKGSETPKEQAKQGGQQDPWAALIAAAQKEGEVVVPTFLGGEPLQAIRQMWDAEKFGVNLKITTMAPNDFVTKISTERKAGLFTMDVALHGTNSLINNVKKENALDPIDDSVLIHPEVKDLSKWWQGKFPYVDKEKMVVLTTLTPDAPIIVNTSKVKPESLTSYFDLLKPEFKGKIVLSDPAIRGSSQRWFGAMLEGKILDRDYFVKLKPQLGAVTADVVGGTQWVAQGKYSVGLGFASDKVDEVIKAGAPVVELNAKEGALLTTGGQNLALFNKAPHPNASKLFINWILTKKVLERVAELTGANATRVDIPVEKIPAANRRLPGVKYFDTSTPEFTKKLPQYTKISDEIFK